MTQILLGVAEDDSDDRRNEELALQLRRELLDLDVESVEPLSADAPEGTRSGLATVAGALVATLGSTPYSAVGAAVLGWIKRSPVERSVRIEIDGDVIDARNVDSEAQAKLIEAFVARHAEPLTS